MIGGLFRRGKTPAQEAPPAPPAKREIDASVRAEIDQLVSRGMAHLEGKRHDLAAAAFDEVLARDPDHLVALYQRAKELIDEGEPQEAIQLLEKAIKADMNFAKAVLALGKAYASVGDYQRARRAFRHLVKLEEQDAEAQVLYSRAFSPWWEAVAGVRFDARPAPSHTWFAIGVQGLAPQMIDLQATAYIGQSGHFAARLEAEHDLHITQRTVFQPLVELSLSGKDDPDRGIGAGLSTGEVGFRVRYEFRRELAPYAGVVWHRKLFGTGDAARAQGKDAGGWHLVTGLRWWI